MTSIIIFLPKKRMNDCNKRRWKFNHHKKPQYLLSEMNKVIRNHRTDNEALKVLWRDEFHSKYQMKR
jgi:hypothetical protein